MSQIASATRFQRYFDIRFANRPELLEQAHRLRYDVYCQEFRYEREEDCPGALECDDYDIHALHLLVTHRETATPAGCVRMVQPPEDDPTFLLPLERYCSHTLRDSERHPKYFHRADIAEISRLAVHTTFRRRLGESESPIGSLQRDAFTDHEQRAFPLVSLALFAGATALLALTARQQMYVMMEPRLARRLRSLGFPFVQVGERTDYHGTRAAYHVTVAECLDSWGEIMQQVYEGVYPVLRQQAADAELSLCGSAQQSHSQPRLAPARRARLGVAYQ